MIILETDSLVGYMLALDTPIQIFYMGISFDATHSRPWDVFGFSHDQCHFFHLLYTSYNEHKAFVYTLKIQLT